jgi:hypothetical protein
MANVRGPWQDRLRHLLAVSRVRAKRPANPSVLDISPPAGRVHLLALAYLLASACTHQQQFYLQNRGSVVVSSASETVEVSRRQRLFVEWGSGARHYSTAAVIREGGGCKGGAVRCYEAPVTANVVEANKHYIRLRSHAWKSLDDVPEAYMEAGSGVRILGDRDPTIVLPTASLRAICIYDRKLTSRELLPSGKSLLLAAGSSAASFTVGRIARCGIDELKKEEDRNTLEDMTARDYLIAAGGGALVGVVLYSTVRPVYNWCRVRFGGPSGSKVLDHSTCYPLGEGGDSYTLRVITDQPKVP